MPIQLDKILADIAEEKSLHSKSETPQCKKDQEEAWIRVGKKNKLSAHEAKSIFKVLQKKYEQEILKPSSTWKLYHQMVEICRKEEEVKPKTEPEEASEMEEDSFVEFLEVREDEEDYDGDSDNQAKSSKSNSSTGFQEKDSPRSADTKPEHKLLNTQMMIPQTTTPVRPDYSSTTQQKQVSAAFTNALQKKGIIMRKTSTPGSKPQAPAFGTTIKASQTRHAPSDSPRSMLLTEGIKRKLQHIEKREEAVPPKKSYINTSSVTSTLQPSTTSQAPIPPVEIKQEAVEDIESSLTTNASSPASINIITIPSNPPTTTELSNGITTIKTNGFNTRIEDIDFQKDIIFDNNSVSNVKPSNAAGEIINIGNFENQLPPTFFKNLCNSQRHEALGLYVANVMNRVTGKSAAKLELNILKAIVEAQSDELARL